MEIITAKVCRMTPFMTVKDRKKSLSVDFIERGEENMTIFHFSSFTLSASDRTCILEVSWQIRGLILQGGLVF